MWAHAQHARLAWYMRTRYDVRMESNRGALALRAWMDEHKHTQETLAERLGTLQQNVSSWLGGRAITLANAVAVNEVTGIPVENWVQPAIVSTKRRSAKRVARSA